jgi:outer membrane protein assembly factor BamB
VRAPNWIHHEPVVTTELAIVGFGNNERSGSDSISGSAPGGIIAFDRRTGRERWQRITNGAVMTSPVLADSVVAVITGGGEAIGWRVRDGAELWRRPIPSYSAMGNPLLVDSLMVFGVEPRTICAIVVRSGGLQYCRSLDGYGSGAGHTSVARAGDLALLVFDNGQSAANENLNAPLSVTGLAKLTASWLSLSIFAPEPKELVMVGVNLSSGREVWRSRIGSGLENVKGHIAGTPVVAGNAAYVPSPVNGDVVAIRADSGRALWSTHVRTARGSVLVVDDAVIAATTDSNVVVLDARTGKERCRQKLPGRSDRAGPTLSGSTGVLTLQNGIVMARPIADWLHCRA